MKTSYFLFFSLLWLGHLFELDNDSTSFLAYKQQPIPEYLDEDENNQSKHILFYYHQWCNFIAWGILVDIGIIANRYGILLKNRVDLHAIIMSIVIFPSIIAELFLIHEKKFEQKGFIYT